MDGAPHKSFRHIAWGTGSVHEGRNTRQPYMDDGSEDSSASSADYRATPDSADKAGKSHAHRSSDQNCADTAELRRHTRQYTLSEPFRGQCKNCDEVEEELRVCRQKCQAERETSAKLRTQLFQLLKEGKEYQEAELVYCTMVAANDPENSEDTAILDLKYSFAEMLMDQKKFDDAELISRAVWEKRQFSPESEEFKMSHRQLCSILVSLKKYGEAENMHRTMYHKEPKDSWALENGDAVCRTIAEQGQYDQAQLMQESVWKIRQRYDGQRHDLTIRSGLQRIAFLEMLLNSTSEPGISEAEKRLSSHRKKVFECAMEVMLRNIWDTKWNPEPIPGILDAGHKLGNILFTQAKFAESEAVLLEVWEGRKRKFGDADVNAMATGSMLGKALLHQGKSEAYSRAVTICRGIWLARKSIRKWGDIDTISSGDDLAQAYFSLEDWPEAEHIYSWIVDQKAHKFGGQAPETVDARWRLGQILFKQGGDKHHKASTQLGAVYQRWNEASPHAKVTLKCGHMLAELLQPQEGKEKDALQVSRDVFCRRKASTERDVDYLDSGRLYGCLLFEKGDILEAGKVLKGLWAHEARGTDEKKMRAKCGYLYGQVLAKQENGAEAKEVLEKVAASQGALFPAGCPEIDGTSRLLKVLSDRCKEMEKEKEKQKQKQKQKQKEKQKEKEKEKERERYKRHRRGWWG